MDNALADEPLRKRNRESLLKFVKALSSLTISADSPPFRRHLAALFESEGIDFRPLAGTAMRALRLCPVFKELLEDADRLGTAAIQHKLRLPGYLEALDDPLAHRLLRRTIVTDLSLERLLTIIRREYLQREEDKHWELSPNHFRFMVSLACQCFNNEYVYATSAIEEESLERLTRYLRRQLGSNAEGLALGLGGLIVFAMYAPLWTLGVSDNLLRMRALSSNPDLQELVTRQACEHLEEEEIQKTIRSFGMSGEPLTDAVRRQYEESPFPRWLDMTLDSPVRFAGAMRERFPFLGHIETKQPVKILIAGCGTGYHPIRIATKYSDATILAVDISKASLAYAIRQARRYGLSNIEFLHGDILCVERLGMQFDAVECLGVLHHLADPTAGLRALASVLIPGGYMRIGVYSRRARAYLQDAQSLVASRGISRLPNDLRKIRQEIIAKILANELKGKRVPTHHSDFYHLSGFRDLLCHTHEVQFSPVELGAVFRRLNLSFLGYSGLDDETRAAYAERFPMDSNMRDLELLEQFEAEHPDMFVYLQILWLSKNGAG
jgi:2-polyprenyl-3-methyl-5-hydroxy-6-metoxy-1,4-benzoquinol methylase